MECINSVAGKYRQSDIVKVYYIDCYEDQWMYESNHMTFWAASGKAGFTGRNIWWPKGSGTHSYSRTLV